MKTKRFDFNFKPLQLDISLTTGSSVPDSQNYDADTNEWTPDYTLTPLIIQPNISRMDKDEILTAGRINQALANIRWYEIIDGTKTLIEANNTHYEITSSGGDAGRIKVKKNVQPLHPLTLQFHAEYTDSRNGQLFVIDRTYFVPCKNATAFAPVVVLDAAGQTTYNPLIDPDLRVVAAKLMLGKNECAAANRLFVWEKFRDDTNTWSEIGSEPALDYDVTVAQNGASVTVDRSLMGSEINIRCRAKYDAGGNPAGVTLNAASPVEYFSFIRQIPKYDYDIVECPTNIPKIAEIAPRASIWGVGIENPSKELLVKWYVAPNRASGSLTYTQIAHGLTPILSTAAMTDLYGGVFGIEVVDGGPWGAWEDSDGYIIEDSDGAVLLVH